MSLLLMLLAGCVLDRQHYQAIVDEIASGDRDGDGYEDAAEGGDDCDDLNATIHPDAEETWEDGVTDNDCDGEREAVQTEYGARALYGETAGAQAGHLVDVIDDLNGDGLAEILVSGWFDSSRFESGGAVYLVMGATSGSLGDWPAIRPSGAGYYLGSALGDLPDLDGDGVSDLFVGALGFDEEAGVVWLVSGAALVEGDVVVPDDAIGQVMGSAAGSVTGADASALGDVMGDGERYLSVTAQLTTVGDFTNAGNVGLFPLRELGEVAFDDAPILVQGTYEGAIIGSHVMAAGDQDGDGIDDYMVSADSDLLAVIVPGGRSAPSLESDAIFSLTAAGEDRESAEVRMIGDIDGDGAADLAAVPLTVNDETVAPQVSLYTALAGSVLRTTEFPSAVIEVGDASYVFDVRDAGDLDGDGRSEVLLPIQGYGPVGTSAIALHFGDTLGYGARVDAFDAPLTGLSARAGSRFGYRAASGPDVDGDGSADIVLGGWSDSEGGEDAGAATVVSLPH